MSTPASKARYQLGREFDCVVYDAWDGLDPDALGAVTGSLVGGGAFLLLLPSPAQLPEFVDPHNARIAVYPWQVETLGRRWWQRLMARIDTHSSAVERWSERDYPDPAHMPGLHRSHPQTPPTSASDLNRPTPEQQSILDEILLLQHRTEPAVLILTADRGRGKSAVLGMAIATLRQQRLGSVLLTAPGRNRAAVVLKHLTAAGYADAGTCFRAPDVLVAAGQGTELLFVDEAAALPEAVLEGLVTQYPKLVLASTVHGYEGSGRGFALRFQRLLKKKGIDAVWHTLQAPVRWQVDDPLEAWSNRILLLDAEPVAAASVQACDVDGLQFEVVDRDQLSQDEEQLTALYGLLVAAHYQTRPMDLRQILDGPNIRLLVAKAGQAIVAAVMCAIEGKLPESLWRDIAWGKRRPQGHLLPQTLTYQSCATAADLQLSALRIVRIAVHPEAVRRGIGSRLLGEIKRYAAQLGLDYLGASFGVTAELLNFWRVNRYVAAHLGMRRNPASGLNSLIVLQGLTTAGHEFVHRQHAYFSASLPVRLGEQFRDLDASVVLQLLMGAAESVDAPSKLERQLIEAFAFGHRGFESLQETLRSFFLYCLHQEVFNEWQEDQDLDLLIKRLWQGYDWAAIQQLYALPGRKVTQQRLRTVFARMLNSIEEPVRE